VSAQIFIFAGAVVLLSAWLPLLLRNSPLSLPMVALAVGWVVPLFVAVDNPLVAYGGIVEHVTEVVLLSAIYGAGLKVDRRFGFRRWSSTWRLLFVVMPLSIALIVVLAMGLMQFSLGFAILLAAILAPTDPVLASDLQLGPPGKGEEGEARFGLTTEAGLNDGLAFPFVILGMAVISGEMSSFVDIAHWFGLELIARTVGGAVLGVAVGIGLINLNRILPEQWRLHVSNSGLAGISLAFITYGVCELMGINGFVAVFCEAVAARNATESFDYAQRLAHAAGQIERALMVFVMLFFGFSLSHGLLEGTRPELVVFAVLVLLVVRPLCTWIGFFGTSYPPYTRRALGYFGIRGIGSIYYLAYVVARNPQGWNPDLLTATALTVLISVVLYGVTSPFAIARLVEPASRP
jgi:NhaP-type Na+/H+ or K+/H+ antiporter